MEHQWGHNAGTQRTLVILCPLNTRLKQTCNTSGESRGHNGGIQQTLVLLRRLNTQTSVHNGGIQNAVVLLRRLNTRLNTTVS